MKHTLNVINTRWVRYIFGRKYDCETADSFLDLVWSIGDQQASAAELWEQASEHVI